MLMELDKQLAQRYGSYASYSTDDDPILEAYGDGPADEVDRLLNRYTKLDSRVLDLGCGAGFTLCRLALQVAEVWGFDEDADLLAAARQRVAELAITNARCVLGNVAVPADVAQLPDNTFDVAFSRRGPNVNAEVIRKLAPNAWVIQELVQGTLGLQPLFGREPFLPQVGSSPHWLIDRYSEFDLLPVSVTDYFYETFYRDAEHLARSLRREKLLWNWTMPDIPYDDARDRAALELYARYNTTPRGISVMHHRTVYLFRRAEVHRFPAIPEAKPLYSLY